MENYMAARKILQSLCSFRMTPNELVILSEAKNLDKAPTHYIGTDSATRLEKAI